MSAAWLRTMSQTLNTVKHLNSVGAGRDSWFVCKKQQDQSDPLEHGDDTFSGRMNMLTV